MKPSVEESRQAAVVPAVNVCTRRKHPLQPHVIVVSRGHSSPLLFITPSCTLALSISPSFACSLSFCCSHLTFFCPVFLLPLSLYNINYMSFPPKTVLVLMLGQRSKKLLTRIDSRFYWFELSYIMSLCLQDLRIYYFNIRNASIRIYNE